MSRLSEFFRTRGVDSRLLFARGAVMVFGAQAGYIAVLMFVTLIERWMVHSIPGFTLEAGTGRIGWMALVFTLTLVTLVAQVIGMKLLAHAIRPWSSHSIPAIASLIFALVGFVALLAIFVLLLMSAHRM